MSMWYNNFDSTFWLSVGTLMVSGLSVCMAYALKSKCSQVKFCFGCIDIVRDIDAELDVEESNNNNQPIDVNHISVHQPSIPDIPQAPRIRRSSLRNTAQLKEIIDHVVTSTKGKEMLESISNKSNLDSLNETISNITPKETSL